MSKHGKRLALLLNKQLQAFSQTAAPRVSALQAASTPAASPVPGSLADAARPFSVITQRATLPAQTTCVGVPVTGVVTDLYGAVSVALDTAHTQEQVYQNVDGLRIEDGRYQAFLAEVASVVPAERQYTDAVRTFAYGTDASFYRLNPKAVLKVHSEDEIRRILPIATKHQVPVTFRAAGTSLSGQAITDSVLLKLSHTGKNFRKYKVHGDGRQITVEPGLIGGEVNKILAAHQKRGAHPVQYKIGPDPSSIDSCMIGGIVSNNSSGMCCGVSQNTYHTLKDMRMVLMDGTVLDTGDAESCASFLKTHQPLVSGVLALARQVQSDRELTNLIRRKFAIKCTTGYSLNALVDFPLDNPIEIIKHLMIGSEGTLGFVSQATYNTVPEWPHKASAFIVFPDVSSACEAAAVLRNETAVDAVELFDQASLKECANNEDMTRLVPCIGGEMAQHAAALLIECRGQSQEALKERICEVTRALARSRLPLGAMPGMSKVLEDYPFHVDQRNANIFWNVRKGLIPIVGAAREAGTSMLIEDVACPVNNLAGMMLDLIDMFQRYGYKDASCFGHALEGNLHLVFSQGFRDRAEVQRFSDMMEEMCHIVATKHAGSLKGEHGTGRNVAPFVEMEWGAKAYGLMWRIKELFDPMDILNPGVILNKDPGAHVKFLKAGGVASPLVDRCIECGFCESNCPSKDLTLTPRQRITVFREISRLRQLNKPSTAESMRLVTLEEQYEYQGTDTCAADGMCQEKCPVKINTGDLIKSIRSEQMSSRKTASGAAMWVANNFGVLNSSVPTLLNAVSLAHRVVGPTPLSVISKWMNRMTGNMVPVWNPAMPRGASKLKAPLLPVPGVVPAGGLPRRVVYVPSCVTRMMGPAAGDYETESVHEKLMSLFHKAGYEVILPKQVGNLCCGMLFNSRGLKDAAAVKGAEMEVALLLASEGGKLPIVMDTSPCLAQVKAGISEPALRFSLYEPVEFIRHFLVDKLDFKKVRDSVAIHVPCSSKKMGIEESFTKLAGLCAHEVSGSGVPCCGMAGDRGMRYPELTASSLQHLALPTGCTDGYSSSRTCEMSLTQHSGINFRGLVYLVDEATTAKSVAPPAQA